MGGGTRLPDAFPERDLLAAPHLIEVGRHRHRRANRDAGLQDRATVKLAEVEERIADLVTIRDNLRAALDAGCADLIACAGNDCCPIPFETLTIRPTR